MMLRAVSWLKDAITTKGVIVSLTHYMLEPGRMGATDGRVCAMHPVDYDGPASLLPGERLEKVLLSVGPDKDLTLTWPEPTQAVLKAGKFKCTFATMDRAQWPYEYNTMLAQVQWHDWTDELLEALRHIEPFMGDNAQRVWSTCIGFRAGHLWATSNVAIAKYRVDHPAVADMDVLLPRWAYDFIMTHTEHLTAWGVLGDAWFFKWDTGAWARCAGVVGTFPEQAGNIIDTHPLDTDSAFVVTAEWKSAYHQLVELTPSTEPITLTDHSMEGGTPEAQIVLETGLGNAHPFTSKWTPKFLTPVVARADYIDFTNFPKPCGFTTPDGKLSGVVLGRLN